jgi:peptidoglycan/xylan/chitin deacetylase (PgdA/CDA1 family)
MTIVSRIANAARSLIGSDRGSRSVRGPTILLYHRIGEERFDPWAMTVSSENFADQMNWLAKHRTVMPLVDFADAHRREAIPEDAVAITFDDGYACNARVAAQILTRMRLPATVFLSVEPIERGGEFWWDELQRIVMDFRHDRLSLKGERIELGPRQAKDADWAPASPPRTSRQKAFKAIWSRLQQATAERRETLMGDLRAQTDQSGPSDPLKRPMTSAEIRSANTTLQFGSHALTHSSLPALTSSAKAREIQQSRDRVEALTGICPTSFAYPFGDADKECESLVEEAGYTSACVTGERAVATGSRLFALPRKGVGNFGADGLADLLGKA